VRVLVANAGSSSLKLRVLEADDRVSARADLPVVAHRMDASAIERWLAPLGRVDVVGHRVVHGGADFTCAVRVDDRVVHALEALCDLAPLHQPLSLAVLAELRRLLPDAPHVACFDTAFHATLPPEASTYALPAEWRARWGLRRFGFHGLSHAYASRRARALTGDARRIVTCHLGAGASLAAVLDGRSVETTMGFTPLEGLVMATRSGSLDPGLVLWLEQHTGMSADALADALEHRSGLLGLAGTADMRELEARAAAHDVAARLALDVYLHRLRAGIAAMAAAMGGVDVIVFTGGVGENSPLVRARAAEGLGFLGVRLDAARNATGAGDRAIGAAGAPAGALVVPAREDLQIAHETRAVMSAVT
jgi:acetate kinase